jgi:hypothetical protein
MFPQPSDHVLAAFLPKVMFYRPLSDKLHFLRRRLFDHLQAIDH